MAGPWPRRPPACVWADAPAVTPCQLRVSATTSNFPLDSFAIRSAASFASPPVERNIARSSGAGSVARSRSASEITGGDSDQEFRCMTSRQARSMASTTRGWLWPIVAQIWPAVKSSTRLPSSISMNEPEADLTRPGAKGPP